MSVLSGIGGAINGVTQLRTWQIDPKTDLASYASSNTLQAMAAMEGNTDWTGSYSAYGSTPVSMPTEALSFAGSIDGTNGATGTAIVDSVEISWDIEGAKPIEHVVNFSGNGALTIEADASADASVTLPLPSKGRKVELGTLVDAPVWTEVSDVRTIKLTISANNKAYASSSSSGGMLRLAGNIDCGVSYSVYAGDWAALPTLNQLTAIRLYDAAATFWLINWMIVGETTGLQVDREGAGLVGATINLKHLPIATIDAGGLTAGTITNPATSEWWPF